MTPIGLRALTLIVRNLAAMTDFYHRIIGLDVLSEGSGKVTLGRAGVEIVVLHEDTSLPARPAGSAGLFHTAILYETPAQLASVLGRVARFAPQLYTGSGDHHVSQAFYLDDPEGNGVELYVDRPAETWIWKNGRVHMTTRYIDPTEFMATHGHTVEVESAKLGHVHLQVGDIAGARRFYVDGLGFDETATLAGQALFVSTGGYHHHLAMNVWGTAGTGERTPSLGLGVIDLSLPTRADLDARIEPVTASVLSDDGRTVTLTDPWKNLVRLTAAA